MLEEETKRKKLKSDHQRVDIPVRVWEGFTFDICSNSILRNFCPLHFMPAQGYPDTWPLQMCMCNCLQRHIVNLITIVKLWNKTARLFSAGSAHPSSRTGSTRRRRAKGCSATMRMPMVQWNQIKPEGSMRTGVQQAHSSDLQLLTVNLWILLYFQPQQNAHKKQH